MKNGSANEAAPSSVKQRVGRPFPKGKSGNPNGRPAKSVIDRKREQTFRVAQQLVVQEIVPVLRAGVPAAINALMELVEDPKTDAAVRANCANALLDRVYGKPIQSTQLAVADMTPRDPARVTTLMRSVLDRLAEARDNSE